MAEVNIAYSCLSDPVKRLTYDQTGEKPKVDNTHRLAMDLVMQMFLLLLKEGVEGDLVGKINGSLIMDKMNLHIRRREGEEQIAKLNARRGDLTISNSQGLNLWETLIDDQVRGFKAALGQIETELAVRDRALEIIADYKDKPGQTLPFLTISFTGSATGAW